MALPPVHFRLDSASGPQALFNLIPLPAYVFDETTTTMLAVNAAALERYGYTEAEFLALSARDLRPVEDRELVEELVADSAVHRIYRGTTHKTKSGQVLDVQVVGHRIVYEGHDARLVIVVETTERSQMAQALVESRQRLQALWDNALDAIVLADDCGRYVDANPAACALFGFSRDEMLQQTAYDALAEEDGERRDQMWQAFRADGTAEGEVSVVDRTGSRRRVEFHAVANVLPGIHLAILRDVTDRRRLRLEAEEKLRESHRQLRAVAARARARREEDRTRLARELHDQLGQSLAGLKMDVFWVRDRIGATSTDQVLAKIDSMLFLLDDTIHRVRRISSDLRPPVLDRLGLVPALEWAAEEFGRRSNIATHVAADVHDVPLDRGRSTAVFRIVQEALTNVATHSHATRVDVRVTVQDDTLTVQIGDNGEGIAPSASDGTHSLGLLGMHERAALLGGTTGIQSTAGEGTLVTVTVPIRERRRMPRDD